MVAKGKACADVWALAGATRRGPSSTRSVRTSHWSGRWLTPSADRRGTVRLAIWRSDRDGLRCAHARACMRACVRVSVGRRRALLPHAATCLSARLVRARPCGVPRGRPGVVIGAIAGVSARSRRKFRRGCRSRAALPACARPLRATAGSAVEDGRHAAQRRSRRCRSALARHGTARLSKRDCRLLSVSVSWFRRGTAGSQLPRA